MSFTTVWGILPVYVTKSTNNWGQARAMVVYLPEDKGRDTALYHHELFHVKQFYVYMLLTIGIGALAYFITLYLIGLILLVQFGYTSKWGKARREIAAYAESIRFVNSTTGQDVDTLIDRYAGVFNDSNTVYNENMTLDAIKKLMRQRVKDKRLF